MHGSIARFFTVEGVCREPETVVGVGWVEDVSRRLVELPLPDARRADHAGLIGRRVLESS
jgi:hypothetical protein